MPFYDLEDIPDVPLVNGITLKAIYSEKSSISFLDLPAYSRIPTHHHPSEQIGIVLEGAMQYTIGEETKVCRKGTAFVIPPHAPHSLVVVSGKPAKLVDIFTPKRQVSEPLQYMGKKEE
jgi:quercetin dioxygenase-like cupin family protein